ncbi:MAG: GDP-mannose 4,6-dehydratase, partial [Rhodospirillaceae bacterium]|nr:GDP-mannose 4,6-dehydratase [Rhodospirillaceae bacterium]
SNGILFNHEGPLRGETFVSRKLTRSVASSQACTQDKLYLGNLDARRDWGHARDYVEGMWRIVQQDAPGDFVLATGEAHTVREFVDHAFEQIGVDIDWQGEGPEERGIDSETGVVRVQVDPRYFRPTEVDCLIGDARKAEEVLGWKATTGFQKLVAEMVAADRTAIADGQPPRRTSE